MILLECVFSAMAKKHGTNDRRPFHITWNFRSHVELGGM
jgi:hypothetical protein